MLLTLRTTRRPATDLGYLLAKHPDREQEFDLPFGRAYAFYPEASESSCTFALLLDIDPIGLVRGRPDAQFALRQYVHDRPFVSSSFLSAALSKILGSALNGRCTARPDLALETWPLEARLPVVSCEEGEDLVRRLFEPLGYDVACERHPLDDRFPEWGNGSYHALTLRQDVRLQDLLTHLYVLVPVLDDDKHYWVGSAEVEKLLEKGGAWLPSHPEKELITRRYLKHRGHLTREALSRLAEEDDPDPDRTSARGASDEEPLERPMRLDEQRIESVVDVLRSSAARTVLDLGCGEGKLLDALMRSRAADGPSFDRVAGMDVSVRCLENAAKRLDLDRMPERLRNRIRLFQGSLTYRDARLEGFDAACLVEVIEHVDPPRLEALERVLFQFARPRVVVVTTPNREYNARFPSLPAGRMRHRDHRFEWTRAEFRAWSDAVAKRRGYGVRYLPIGPEDPELGTPTQMGVFER